MISGLSVTTTGFVGRTKALCDVVCQFLRRIRLSNVCMFRLYPSIENELEDEDMIGCPSTVAILAMASGRGYMSSLIFARTWTVPHSLILSRARLCNACMR